MSERGAAYATEYNPPPDWTLLNEYDHQCALFRWREESLTTYPALKWMFATLNGVRLTPGVRVKASRAGMIKGVLDVWLPVRVGDCPGLAFELKHGHNRPTPEQAAWLAHLAADGWHTGVYYTWRAAAEAIIGYLEGV